MLIVLSPYKFTEYHFKYYELDVFEKKLNQKFEVHDLSKIINPKIEHIFKLKRHKKVKVFNSIKKWQIHINKINSKYENVDFLNLLQLTDFKSLYLHILLKRYKKKIIQIKSMGQPNLSIEKKTNNLLNIKNNVNKLNFNFLLFHLKMRIIKILVKFITFSEINYLVCGNLTNFETNLKSKKKICLNYHFHDFSKLNLHEKKRIKNKKRKKIAVFLDCPGPYFDDDYKIFGLNINYDKFIWYRDLNKFLSHIEKIYSCRVIILPHPKVKGLTNPYYDKKYHVNHDPNAVYKLIPRSEVVISINASTAIGIAAACRKRILCIYNDQIKKLNNSLFERSKFIANKINASFINMNYYDDDELFKPISNKKYQDYIYNYITSKKILDKKNYEIFNSLLRK